MIDADDLAAGEVRTLAASGDLAGLYALCKFRITVIQTGCEEICQMNFTLLSA